MLVSFLLMVFSEKIYAADTIQSYPDLLLDDVQYVLTKPSRWHTDEWKNLAWASLSVISAATILDAPIRDEMRHQPNGNEFMLTIQRFGAAYSIGVVSGFYIAGSLANNDTAIRVAQDSLSASIIASGLIAPTIKFIVGRNRPYENVGTATFNTFSGSSLNSSFPSGHTTEAFTLASVISSHYEESWIQYSSYTVATLVGIARIYNDAHFTSDVLAGAFIGTWVGQSVAAHNQTKRDGKLILMPETSQDLIGISIVGNF